MTAQASGVAWEASPERARERARAEGKPVLLDFTAAPM